MPDSAGHDEYNDESYQHLPELQVSDLHFRPQRRKALPIFLFVATCLSTFWVGVAGWDPLTAMGSPQAMARLIRTQWPQGLTYMAAVLAILIAHEMGHFWQTVRHRIPASFPLCIPLPINPFGTMGAVIGMDGLKADRREIFDIGIAGPIAGLVLAIPIMWFGVRGLDLSQPPADELLQLHNPLLVQWMIELRYPEWADRADWVALDELNAFFMAGWVGMLITGLNMMPISQLDGGHVIYALFGRGSKSIARFFTILAIAYVVIYLDQAFVWTPMLILVILLGIHHPPTANDHVEIGPLRRTIGLASLIIPILCFPLLGFRM